MVLNRHVFVMGQFMDHTWETYFWNIIDRLRLSGGQILKSPTPPPPPTLPLESYGVKAVVQTSLCTDLLMVRSAYS